MNAIVAEKKHDSLTTLAWYTSFTIAGFLGIAVWWLVTCYGRPASLTPYNRPRSLGRTILFICSIPFLSVISRIFWSLILTGGQA